MTSLKGGKLKAFTGFWVSLRGFTSILKTLLEHKYEGYVSIEVSPPFGPDPITVASRAIGYVKGIMEALEGMS